MTDAPSPRCSSGTTNVETLTAWILEQEYIEPSIAWNLAAALIEKFDLDQPRAVGVAQPSSETIAQRLIDRADSHERMAMGSAQHLGFYSAFDAKLMREAAEALRGVAQPSSGSDKLFEIRPKAPVVPSTTYCTPGGPANCEAWAADKRCPTCPHSSTHRNRVRHERSD